MVMYWTGHFTNIPPTSLLRSDRSALAEARFPSSAPNVSRVPAGNASLYNEQSKRRSLLSRRPRHTLRVDKGHELTLKRGRPEWMMGQCELHNQGERKAEICKQLGFQVLFTHQKRLNWAVSMVRMGFSQRLLFVEWDNSNAKRRRNENDCPSWHYHSLHVLINGWKWTTYIDSVTREIMYIFQLKDS